MNVRVFGFVRRGGKTWTARCIAAQMASQGAQVVVVLRDYRAAEHMLRTLREVSPTLHQTEPGNTLRDRSGGSVYVACAADPDPERGLWGQRIEMVVVDNVNWREDWRRRRRFVPWHFSPQWILLGDVDDPAFARIARFARNRRSGWSYQTMKRIYNE